MKTVIVTLWNSMNYGAFFQAFSLYYLLERNGFNPCFLKENITTKKLDIKSLFSSKSFKQGIYRLKLYKKYKKSWKQYRVSDSSMNYDYCVLGSDEIWNVNNKSFSHSIFFIGEGIKTKTILSYAPSSNGASEKEFESYYGVEPFKKIDFISVRDSLTQLLVKNISRINPDIVLDPTFLYKDFSHEIIRTKYKDYILIYGYHFSEEQASFIKAFAHKNALRTISVGPFHKWCDICYPASPFEFLGLVQQSNYVITSTFHGTVFSLLFEKAFAVFPSENSKISEILSIFELNSRGVFEPELLEKVLMEKIDYNHVNDLINKKRKNSFSFLKKAFSKEVV